MVHLLNNSMTNNSMIEEYLVGDISVSKLSKKHGISNYACFKILEECGIPITPRTNRKHNLDSDFFEIVDNENKAYVLGLMYSDGSVCPRINTGYDKITSYKIRIRLQEFDSDILRKISSCIYGFDNVKIDKRSEKMWADTARFELNSKKMGEDLIKLGCGPNKSNIIRLPSYEKVPERLYRHFLRGFYDGDGGISKTPPIIMNFTSNKAMCLELVEYFARECGLTFSKYLERKNGYGSVKISGRGNCYKLYEYLYSDCSLYMDRKKRTIENCLIDSRRSDISHLSKEDIDNRNEARRINRERLMELYPPINSVY